VSEEVKDTHTLSGTKGGINQDTMRESEGYSQAEQRIGGKSKVTKGKKRERERLTG
jgi:hypothetical protein